MFSRSRTILKQLLTLTGALALLVIGPPARAVEVYQGSARFARVERLEGSITIGHAYLSPMNSPGCGSTIPSAKGTR